MQNVKRCFLAVMLSFFTFFSAHAQDAAVEKRVPDSNEEVILSFAPLVKSASPAVVNIYTKKKITVRTRSPFFNDPLFQHFFGNNIPDGGVTEKIESSLGSGVVVRPDGLIITCHHVISGSDEITVVLNDRREFDAKVMLLDEKTDLALLKIDVGSEQLAHLALMDSDRLEVGDIVLAIGNPFGVGQTVTSGIVSAVARTTVGVSDYQFFIQTDASINPGNSGGALINMEGKLVGVNSAIFSKSGGSNGIGFAIPSNMAATVIDSVATGDAKRVVRPWMGLSVQQVTQDIAHSLGMDRPTGALVAQLYPKGPAAQAGLMVGDVIVGLDSHDILDEHALHFRVATYKIGSEAEFSVLRDGKIKKIQMKMMAPVELPARDIRVVDGKNPLAGVTVANLSPALADELGLNMLSEGVIVMRLGSGIANNAGLATRDVLRQINGKKVESTKQLEKLLANPQKHWEITIQRGSRLLNIIWSGAL